MLQPLVEKAALVQAINEAWIMIAVLTVARFALRAFRQEISIAGRHLSSTARPQVAGGRRRVPPGLAIGRLA